ncbi:GntR family transcriptional regulator [Saccharopolyspora rosea]|uniref:GntR family transcriptional regulator n=1 Tax=Saccharopolyspora rosea TaxID=524884 RepID=A0ABW3FN68_9PSEU|nr:GntR family transcriptional regulator [Saccharopolyspora rosea]
MDTSSPVLLGDQVAASVRAGIAKGLVGPGDSLPPAREVAKALGINVHTVLRGYQQLRDEGVVELRRGRGATITGDARSGLVRVRAQARELVDAARHLGLTDEETLELVRKAQR